MDRTQAAVSVYCRHPRLRRNGAICCCVQCMAYILLYIVNGDDTAVFLSLVTLTFDIQTGSSKGPNTSSL